MTELQCYKLLRSLLIYVVMTEPSRSNGFTFEIPICNILIFSLYCRLVVQLTTTLHYLWIGNMSKSKTKRELEQEKEILNLCYR